MGSVKEMNQEKVECDTFYDDQGEVQYQKKSLDKMNLRHWQHGARTNRSMSTCASGGEVSLDFLWSGGTERQEGADQAESV